MKIQQASCKHCKQKNINLRGNEPEFKLLINYKNSTINYDNFPNDKQMSFTKPNTITQQ